MNKPSTTTEHSLIKDLQAKLSESHIVNPNGIAELAGQANIIADQRTLALRTWKNSLIEKNPTDIVDLIKTLTQSDDKYTRTQLLPMITDSLDKNTITSLLSVLHHQYANKMPEVKQGGTIADTVRVESIDDFTQKKARIRAKLGQMYANKTIDGKFIFGMGIFLLSENKKDHPQFAAGTFREDMQKWLFTGERVENSFWKHIVNPTPEMHSTTEQTTHSLGEAMTQGNS